VVVVVVVTVIVVVVVVVMVVLEVVVVEVVVVIVVVVVVVAVLVVVAAAVVVVKVVVVVVVVIEVPHWHGLTEDSSKSQLQELPTKPFAKPHKGRSLADLPCFGAHAVGKPTVTCPELYLDHPSAQSKFRFPQQRCFFSTSKRFSSPKSTPIYISSAVLR
jgi:hypothetical protein